MPGDSIIQKGSDIGLACNLNSRRLSIRDREFDVDSSMIKFTFKNQVLGGDRVKRLNDTAAEVSINRAQLSDTGLYYCFLDIPNSKLNLTLVCNSHLEVARKFFHLSSSLAINWGDKS